MADTSLLFNIIGKDRASGVVENVSRRVRAASLLAAAAQLALGAAFASAAAHAVGLASAVAPAISLLGLLPSIGAAGVASVLTLGMGFSGMAAALKSTGAAGGGAGRVLGDVAGAERRLAQAQRDAKTAQEALNTARKEAADRIASYRDQVEGAQLDEESATNALADARKRLEEASMMTGPDAADAYRDAELAVRQQEFALDQAKKRTQELKNEQAKATRDGVEGSDEVKQAKDRERAALEQVKAAQEALNRARQGAGGGGGGVNAQAAALAKLAPAARAVVLTLLQLKPAWDGVTRSVQNRFWQGAAADLRMLSGAYLPVARTRLVELAGSFNLAGRESAKLVGSRRFVADVNATLGNTNRAAGILARAVAPIISAFRTWGVVGSAYLPEIAGWVLQLANRFNRWSTAARDSERMAGWFRNGTTAIRQLGTIAGNTIGIVAALLRGGGADSGRTLLATLTAMTGRLRAFLNSTQGQAKISAFFAGLRVILSSVVSLFPILASGVSNFATSATTADGAGGSLADTLNVTRVALGFLAGHTGALAELLPYVAGGFLVYKASQVAANTAAAVGIPLRIAEVAVHWRLSSALRANTAAMTSATASTGANTAATGANTAAGNIGVVARIRGTAALVAQRAALVATTIATRAATAGQWLLNIAMSANPLGLIVIAIVAVAAGLYLLWTRSTTFRRIVTGAFNAVWSAARAGWSWVRVNFPRFYHMIADPIGRGITWARGRWDSFVGFVRNLPGRVSSSLSGMWGALRSGFRNALNYVIGLWNNFSLTLGGGSVLGMNIPSVTLNTPNIPYLATGGRAVGAGLAHVGERGPETVWLPAGATVEPLRGSGHGGGGGQTVRVIVDIRGGEREFRRLIRSWVRVDQLIANARG
ncbi:hypothetical protein [Actinoplanes lobatus]|uniref:Uncharacterized protein n=1 Tax=Actinoplanes lobatus TaxID=113568 RepID=A0A7W7HC03_9ACTN|nr:hypothetical protein [Actinoplanes lobatus]MBB4747744.1 hypothetical protein [Actinoplanes lobatus]